MIYHITKREAWQAAQANGEYSADSLASDGFIHCSLASQVTRVANAGFRDGLGLVVLHIDEAALEAEVRYENLEGGEELFPHVYGRIPAPAVIRATDLVPGVAGCFEFSASEP